MNYLAQGLSQGFSQGFDIASQKKRDKKLLDEQLARDARELQARKALQDEYLTARAKENESNRAVVALDKEAAANDPRTQLARRKAQAELDAMGQPNPDADLAAEVNRLRLQKERDGLVTPQPPPVPTAKVRQSFGDAGSIEYNVPTTDLETSIGRLQAGAYKSPFASQIAELEGDVGKQQAALDGGSAKAGGFFGIGGTPRADIAAGKQREILRLRAAELQDMVAKGVISPEEADKRANALMGGR